MNVLTVEGVVDENGQIQLMTDIQLPQNTKVYVVIPGMSSELLIREPVHIYSPRLANQEEVADFELEVFREVKDADL